MNACHYAPPIREAAARAHRAMGDPLGDLCARLSTPLPPTRAPAAPGWHRVRFSGGAALLFATYSGAELIWWWGDAPPSIGGQPERRWDGGFAEPVTAITVKLPDRATLAGLIGAGEVSHF